MATVAYFSDATVDGLETVDDLPNIGSLVISDDLFDLAAIVEKQGKKCQKDSISMMNTHDTPLPVAHPTSISPATVAQSPVHAFCSLSIPLTDSYWSMQSSPTSPLALNMQSSMSSLAGALGPEPNIQWSVQQ